MWFVYIVAFISAYGALAFVPPSAGGLIASPNYGHPSNGSLPRRRVVPGAAFDRFIQIWLENTDFATAAASPVFQELVKDGIVLSNYFALTHPSEPNYCGAAGGDFFGMGDDDLHMIPANVSTIVDLLEEKEISWAGYFESMLSDGDQDFSEPVTDYVDGPGSPPRAFYVRKHNPLILYNSIALNPARAKLIRNFNDFATDLNASALPQWMFIAPNLVDDGHDTNQTWIDSFFKFWLLPIINDPRFNTPRTLISITYDENEDDSENNNIFNALLGGAIPKHLRGTTDSTYFTHYSLLSTVESNWRLGCLGRNDANKTMANVFSFVADVTGYKNKHVPNPPLTNLSGTIPGPLNPNLPAPWPAPNFHAECAGGGPVFGAKNHKHHDHHDHHEHDGH